MNKKLFSIFAITIFLFSIGSSEAWSQTNEEVATMKQMAQTEIRLVFIRNLALSEEEGAIFWPLYDQYRAEVNKVGAKTSNVINEYIANIQNLTDARAIDLTKRYYEAEKERVDINLKYLEKMMAVLPGKKVAKFLQIENKLMAVGRYNLANKIPLIQE